MRRKSFRLETSNGHRALVRVPERIRDPKVRSARDKIARVFRYLEALNQHRNPVPRHLDGQLWSLWLHDLPSHSSVQRGPVRLSAAAVSKHEIGAEPGDQDFVFKVRRPKLSSPPTPPSQIAAWLKDGWDDPDHQATLRKSLDEPQEQNGPRPNFSDDPKRMEVFHRWRAQRDEWARNEKPARDAMKVFEMLYELHGRLEREAE